MWNSVVLRVVSTVLQVILCVTKGKRCLSTDILTRLALSVQLYPIK